MKVKEIERTANIAWSPQPQHPVYLVAGTAAQQLDATFSTSAALELYEMNLGDLSLDMPLVAQMPSECRFQKLVWGGYGMTSDLGSGVIVAGADNGCLLGFDAEKFIEGDKTCELFKTDKHVGAVKAMDFNPFQNNLLVSGGPESEIFIWDLNNLVSPMTPGAKSQPAEEVACVAWNRQVQHILASTFTARCVVWDLRKNEPIIKVSESMSRIKCKLVCWNPEVATQMCLSSEDDHSPVIQLWDLRYATSPIKVLEHHQRGILSMAWCPQDADLLLSCAKDNRILCWNPNCNALGGEVVYELPTSHQWSFDVQWCPRNPNVISSSSFDGHVTCFSLMGGGHPLQDSNQVTDSFRSTDPFHQAMNMQLQQQERNVMPLQKPPKWLKKPVGANFGFGGKLVSFEHVLPQQSQQPAKYQVTISQVVTEIDLVTASQQLEQALSNGKHVEFCAMKAAIAADNMQENFWKFLMVNFEKEPRERYIHLLGYDKTELAKKVSQLNSDNLSESNGTAVDAQELALKINQLDTDMPSSREDGVEMSSAFDELSISQPLLKLDKPLSLQTPKSDLSDGLLCQALVTGNFEAAVDICISNNNIAEAILLAIAGGPELLSRTQQWYFQKNSTKLGKLVSAIVTHDWQSVVNSWDLNNWKEALAILHTYSPPEDFAALCDTLALRLETEGGPELAPFAGLCYVCSANIEKMVENWISTTHSKSSPMALQDLVEKVMVLHKAVESFHGQAPDTGFGVLADSLSNYASMLAAQGLLDSALRYLGNSTEYSLMVLRDRLYQALDKLPEGISAPCPWQKVIVQEAPSQSRTSKTCLPSTAAEKSTFNTGNYKTGNEYTTMNGSLHQTSYSSAGGEKASLSSGNISPISKGSAFKYSQSANTMYDPTAYNTRMPTSNDYDQQQHNFNGGLYRMPESQASNVFLNSSQDGRYGMQGSSIPVSSHPMVPSYQDAKPDKAWNDPPMIVKKDAPKNKPLDSSPITAPITNPMFSGYSSQPQVGGDVGSTAVTGNYGNLYNPQEYQPEPQHVTPEPVTEPHKAAVPEEYKMLSAVFDRLVQTCQSRAANAQMKKKLDDVTKKLEILYDRLRENSLSPAVTLGLQQIVQSIRQCDYNSALAIYTQMISQGNFTEISTFMPSLKILIQSATQLQVYIQ